MIVKTYFFAKGFRLYARKSLRAVKSLRDHGKAKNGISVIGVYRG